MLISRCNGLLSCPCPSSAAKPIRLQLRRLLQQCSPTAEVLLAEDGGTALRILAERAARGDPPLDLLTMDREMPLLDGPAAISAARRAGYEGFIVGISACTEAERECMIEAGADVCLRKPVSAADLQALLAMQLERRSPGSAGRSSRSSSAGSSGSAGGSGLGDAVSLPPSPCFAAAAAHAAASPVELRCSSESPPEVLTAANSPAACESLELQAAAGDIAVAGSA